MALDLGADDYIVKPFGTSELLARIRTAIRHSPQAIGGETLGGDKITIGELEIDYSKRLVSLSGERIHLTPVEYKILALLSKNAGKVLTRTISCGRFGGYTEATATHCASIWRTSEERIEANPGTPSYSYGNGGWVSHSRRIINVFAMLPRFIGRLSSARPSGSDGLSIAFFAVSKLYY
jgi:two-component system KDP operon response regulator KdpE